jgi:hypothetical protein
MRLLFDNKHIILLTFTEIIIDQPVIIQFILLECLPAAKSLWQENNNNNNNNNNSNLFITIVIFCNAIEISWSYLRAG